jgi:hypothetical protein
MSAGYRYRKKACGKPLAFSRPRAKPNMVVLQGARSAGD